jgi:hypothetical protein
MLPASLGLYWPLFVESAIAVGISEPLVPACICWQETKAGTDKRLDVQGPKGRGDGGHGHGLMQIDDRWWPEFLAKRDAHGNLLWQDPKANIDFATRMILLPALTRLKDVHLAVSAYNCGVGGVLRALRELSHEKPQATREEVWLAGDRYTARTTPSTSPHGNYAAMVFSFIEQFKASPSVVT